MLSNISRILKNISEFFRAMWEESVLKGHIAVYGKRKKAIQKTERLFGSILLDCLHEYSQEF